MSEYIPNLPTLDALDEPLNNGILFLCPADKLSQWQHNPRVAPNPERDSLHASMIKDGFQGVLLVTRPPGQKTYVPANGGNTRVELIQQFHQEGDRRFEHIPCQYQAWDDKSMLGRALRENISRGAMCFYDEAIAIHTLIAPWVTEQLSRNEMRERLLVDEGIKCSADKLENILFLTQYLDQVDYVFTEKRETLKQNDIKKLRLQYNHYVQLFQQSTDELSNAYSSALRDYEHAYAQGDTDLHAFIAKSLDARLATLTQHDVNDVTLIREADAELEALQHESGDPDDSDNAVADHNGNDVSLSLPLSDHDTEETHGSEHVSQNVYTEQIDEADMPALGDINALRSAVFKQAQKVANTDLLSHNIIPSDVGFGFSMKFSQEQNLPSLSQSHLWWLLMNASGFLVSKDRMALLPDAELHSVFNQEPVDMTTLNARMGPPMKAADIVNWVTDPTKPASQDAYFLLLKMIRKLRQQYADEQLWENGQGDA